MIFLLYSNAGSLGGIFSTMLLIFGGIFLALYLFPTGSNIKETYKKGGIKGYYPDIIKFLMKHYPITTVTSDNPLYMIIESTDINTQVIMRFYLRLNPVSKDLRLTGKIFPNYEVQDRIPQDDFDWELDIKYGDSDSNYDVMIALKVDMALSMKIKNYGKSQN